MPDNLADQPLTYSPSGVTRAGQAVPPGMRRTSASRVVGGPEVFDKAAQFVMGLGMQRGLGMRVEAPGRALAVGDVVVLHAGPGRVAFRIPTRIVYLVDEPDRQGFAYGTLPGHPERGEELFVAERLSDGRTRVSVSAVSAPGRWYTKAAGPLGRLVQSVASRGYVATAARHCR